MEFNKLVKKRASIRRYSSKKPKITDIIKAIETSNLAPSPGNLSILRYLIIENHETIEKIAQACQQEFIKQAQFVVVVCSDSKKAEIMYDKRAKKYTKHHTGTAIENFLLKIADMDLASCWVGAFSETTIKTALKIPDRIDVEVVLPVGYQLITDKTKQRHKHSLNGKVFFEVYNNQFQKPIRKAHPG